MQEQLFDFVDSDDYAGFRLEKLEMYNWGTFDQKVWSLHPNGDNCLVTGDIGSGKSTIVDAVTTLFMPAHRIAFNKAAGAEKKERTLRSYVRGFYKTERSEFGHSGTPVALRGDNSYSVILGVFFNKGYNQKITLAQVFWCKDKQGQPDKYYIVAKQPLSIATDFTGFGSDLGTLRKRLREDRAIEVFDRFTLYSAEFRRQFGIKNEHALDLFHQTVSMKSVGNLTQFVRDHMLESFDVQADIAALIGHYDDLNRAHEAVLKAKEQIRQLSPLIENYEEHQKIFENNEQLHVYREGVHSYFSTLKSELLEKKIADLAQRYKGLQYKLDEVEKQKKGLMDTRDDLKRAVRENGGDRLEQLKKEIDDVLERKVQKRVRADRYRVFASGAGLPSGDTAEAFLTNSTRLPALLSERQRETDELQDVITRHRIELEQKKKEHRELCRELDSLKERQSNISSKLVIIRQNLCQALQIDEERVPFAGELLKVKEDASKWEGALERVLHNFGLSLLVPDELYSKVAGYVDSTHLQGRLVYIRVCPEISHRTVDCERESLVHKLEIKQECLFSSWLRSELVRRFNYICCMDLEQFRREKQAITLAGQIKSGGVRHEKDDRYTLHDRQRYILGWNNKQKMKAITADVEKCEKGIQDVGGEIAKTKDLKAAAEIFLKNLHQLGEFLQFSELDWQSDARKADDLRKEQKTLESTSDTLATLSKQLQGLEVELRTAEDNQLKLNRDVATLAAEEKQAAGVLDQCQLAMETVRQKDRAEIFSYLESVQEDALGKHQVTIDSCSRLEQEMRSWLKRQIEGHARTLKRLLAKITSAMHDYCNDFQAETQEVDKSIEAGFEYQRMLERLEADNLPKYEEKFKELLNKNTIREVVQFQARLDKQNETIKERLEKINQSLATIEYNPGRYIELENARTPDPDVREFQQQLRRCAQGSLTGSDDEQYAETKFIEVSKLIDRFKGREECLETDKNWTRKVTDVRNWFTFGASERYLEDGGEYEHYTDTGGKSGGQKEKLAYTVLAASLVYQFGLERGQIRSRSFRFVVIDEAFGRGSDESTRYALNLFRELNLQLLIVTPLQKIHIIEPYVASVGFVHNEGGRESQLRNLTIVEYVKEREARLG